MPSFQQALYRSIIAVLGLLWGAAPAFGQFNWTQQHPATAPSARYGHGMAWDGQRVILFGGITNGGGTISAQTWAWDGANWSLLAPAHSPRWGATSRSAEKWNCWVRQRRQQDRLALPRHRLRRSAGPSQRFQYQPLRRVNRKDTSMGVEGRQHVTGRAGRILETASAQGLTPWR
jgi:hypothetical protein